MKLFEHFSEYERVLVTGPQRSGTRICGKMIACDTGFKYFDEVLFSVNHLHTFKQLLSKHTKSVFQCPGLSHIIEKFSTERTAIIFMIRPIASIILSQQRIKWVSSAEVKNYDVSIHPICEAKYIKWYSVQRSRCHHYFEIDYISLKDHPLWIPSHKRANFKWNQTSL